MKDGKKTKMVWKGKIPAAAWRGDGGQSSHDVWNSLSLKASGERSHAEIDALDHCERKTNTWNKSCKESVKRNSEPCKMVEAAVMDEKQEQKERGHDEGICQSSFKREGMRRTKQEG